jgi:hypothetical protein
MPKVKIFNHSNNLTDIENAMNAFLAENAIKEVCGVCHAAVSNKLFIILIYKEP